MRRTLNENPVAQIAVLAVLAVVVGFLLLTRVANQSGGEPSATSPTASPPPGAGDRLRLLHHL